MINTYVIREGKGVTTEVDLPTAAHLLDRGRLRFTGKRSKWNAARAEMQTWRFYARKDGQPRTHEPCTKPCCARPALISVTWCHQHDVPMHACHLHTDTHAVNSRESEDL